MIHKLDMDKTRLQERIDKVVLHKFWGYPIFFFILFVIFQATFIIGAYPMGWIENGIDLLSHYIINNMPEGLLKDLIIDGIIAGVGGVIVFLPNIAILFLFISVLQSSGYIMRAAKLMDKMMHRIGLSGNSFIPLIMGFGCNVPAIMSTKTIEDKHSRIITVLVNPLMSCSARLPVYLLLCAAFFEKNAGLVIFGIYTLGILLAMLFAYIFRKFVVTDEDTECEYLLTPYRMPSVKKTLADVWDQVSQYLRKMGGIILIASIIIWFLGYFPKNTALEHEHLAQTEIITQAYSSKIEANPLEKTALLNEMDSVLQHNKYVFETQLTENSYIGRIGKSIEPILAPLGFNWKISSALLTGIAGKELIVSTMGVLYAGDDGGNTLIHALVNSRGNDFNPAIALSFLVFVLIYFPCIATITSIRAATKEVRWSIFTIIYTSLLAWIVSFAVYRIALLIL
ncbi:MAG: ferrous iron transport protein B [Bacteroidales bacterium]